MSDTVEWRWVDIDGSQSALRFEQLADALSSGSLPRFVLVWRTGWTEWFSAERVADLASAIGTVHSSPLTAVRITEGVTSPPAPPIDRYATLALGTMTTLLHAKHKAPLSTVPPPPPPRPPGRLPLPPPRAPVAGIPAPPQFIASPTPIPVRDVLPTLAGEEPVRSPTLRPVGGMPPPPRTIPQSKLPEILDEDVVDPTADTELDVTLDDELPPPAIEIKNAPTPAKPAVTRPQPFPTPPADLIATQRSEKDVAPPQRSVQQSRRSPDLGGASRQAVSRATMIGVLLPGTVLLTAALVRIALKSSPSDTARKPSTEIVAAAPAATPTLAAAAPALASATAAAPSHPTKGAGCTFSHEPVRLAEAAFGAVPLLATQTPDHASVAIGFASARDHAVGIVVDPSSLAVTPSFDQAASDSVTLGVVPLVSTGTLSFAVDRVDPKFSFSRTIDAKTRFAIGVTAAGFARSRGPKMDLVWPGKSKNPTITTPRVASVKGLGHAVTFRHGGQDGKVLVGWLDEKGAKLTELRAVSTEAVLVGTPTIAASDDAVLVTFASKTAPEAGFRAELAVAPRGGLPEHAVPFTVPAGGPGGEAISPSAEALPGGRFLLQWTEGSAGNRAVRAQMISANLVPVGEPVTLSTAEQNAGQGALWVNGETALALFLVKKDSTNELWGRTIRCP